MNEADNVWLPIVIVIHSPTTLNTSSSTSSSGGCQSWAEELSTAIHSAPTRSTPWLAR